MGRRKTCQQRGKDQDGNHDGESRWLGGSHSIYQVHQETPCCQSGKYAHTNAGENHSETLPEHKPHDIAGASPERYADAEFRHALARQVSQHTINADARQQQSQTGEDAKQQQTNQMMGERAASHLYLGTNLVKSLIAFSTAQFPPQWFDRIQWRAAGPDGNRHEFGPTTQQRVWHLGKGIIELCAHLSLIVAGQTPIPHMAHYPHHPDGVGAHLWDPEALPDRLLSAEGVLRQNVINHYDELLAHAIVVIEESALAQRDSHDL